MLFEFIHTQMIISCPVMTRDSLTCAVKISVALTFCNTPGFTELSWNVPGSLACSLINLLLFIQLSCNILGLSKQSVYIQGHLTCSLMSRTHRPVVNCLPRWRLVKHPRDYSILTCTVIVIPRLLMTFPLI
jgi:hypothetical protein